MEGIDKSTKEMNSAKEKTVKLQILSLFEYVTKCIDVTEVLDHLVSNYPWISVAAREQVHAKNTQLEKCRYLLLFIIRTSTLTPYLDFRYVLQSCGYTDLVQWIDSEKPVVYESISPGALPNKRI